MKFLAYGWSSLRSRQALLDQVVAALGLEKGCFVGLTAGKLLAAQKTAGVLRNKLGAFCPASAAYCARTCNSPRSPSSTTTGIAATSVDAIRLPLTGV